VSETGDNSIFAAGRNDVVSRYGYGSRAHCWLVVRRYDIYDPQTLVQVGVHVSGRSAFCVAVKSQHLHFIDKN